MPDVRVETIIDQWIRVSAATEPRHSVMALVFVLSTNPDRHAGSWPYGMIDTEEDWVDVDAFTPPPRRVV